MDRPDPPDVYDLPAAADPSLRRILLEMTPAEAALFEELRPAPDGVEPDYGSDDQYEWLRGPYGTLALELLAFAHEGTYYLTPEGARVQELWKREVAGAYRVMLTAADEAADRLIADGQDEAYLALLTDYAFEERIDRDRRDPNCYFAVPLKAVVDPFVRRCAEQGLVQPSVLRLHPAIMSDNSPEAMVRIRPIPTPFGQKVRRAVLVRRQIRGDQGDIRGAVGDLL